MNNNVNGYSVEVTTTGNLFYSNNIVGSLGDGVAGAFEDVDHQMFIVFNKDEKNYNVRQGIIDKTINYEIIIVGETETEVEKQYLAQMVNGSLKNISSCLKNTNNSVFVASDDLVKKLTAIKLENPDEPLQTALNTTGYQKKFVK